MEATGPTKAGAPHRAVSPGGFTLVELLVVIAVIGVLVSLMMPAIAAVREAARRTQCTNHLRQVGLALRMYHDAQRAWPVGCTERRRAGSKVGRQLAWSIHLLPHLEEAAVFDRFDLSLAYDAEKNRPAASRVIPVYLCPSTARRAPDRHGDLTAAGLAATDYGGMYGAMGPGLMPGNGVLIFDRRVRMTDVTDGIAWTIIVAEDTGRGTQMDGEWANGENIFDQAGAVNAQQHNEIWSDHHGGAFVAMCDASVRFLSERIDAATLRALCTRDAGDEIDRGQLDW